MSEEEERQPLLVGADSGSIVTAVDEPTIAVNSSGSNSASYSVWGTFLIFFFPALGGLLFGNYFHLS